MSHRSAPIMLQAKALVIAVVIFPLFTHAHNCLVKHEVCFFDPFFLQLWHFHIAIFLVATSRRNRKQLAERNRKQLAQLGKMQYLLACYLPFLLTSSIVRVRVEIKLSGKMKRNYIPIVSQHKDGALRTTVVSTGGAVWCCMCRPLVLNTQIRLLRVRL